MHTEFLLINRQSLWDVIIKILKSGSDRLDFNRTVYALGYSSLTVQKNVYIDNPKLLATMLKEVSFFVCFTSCCTAGLRSICQSFTYNQASQTCRLLNYTMATPGVSVSQRDVTAYFEVASCGVSGKLRFTDDLRPMATSTLGRKYNKQFELLLWLELSKTLVIFRLVYIQFLNGSKAYKRSSHSRVCMLFITLCTLSATLLSYIYSVLIFQMHI